MDGSGQNHHHPDDTLSIIRPALYIRESCLLIEEVQIDVGFVSEPSLERRQNVRL